MLRLISFFSKYRDSLLLIVLLLISFNLIIRANDHQRQLSGDAMLAASGRLQETGLVFSDYLNLRVENKKLLDQNIRLQVELETARQQVDAYVGALKSENIDAVKLDSIYLTDIDTFGYMPAHVIKNTTHKSYNYLVLNKGLKHGVKKDIGVVSPEGIVGRVIRVVNEYCLVQSALNKDFELMIRAIPKGAQDTLGPIGFYDWDGKNPQQASITYVSETVPIHVNDEVITTGNSIVFPPGILVGTVLDVEKEGEGGFYRIDMNLATDFDNLINVYILTSAHKVKIDSLEIGLPEE
ncbi:MAG: rod shape-determining protein MreC [Bacteroidia bacterium]|nr:rod shape-determining protein MreC [Bacteroidia bacterium]